MITGLKGNTRVIESRLQQASHHIIPSMWASTKQAAQDIWIPHQLVPPHAVVREWDHDFHERAVSLRPGSSHSFLRDPNHLYPNSAVFYFAHATKRWWISPQMMEAAIPEVQENKNKPKGDQWRGSCNYILHWSLLLWGIRHSHSAEEPERFTPTRDWEQVHPRVSSVSTIQQAQLIPFLAQTSLCCWGADLSEPLKHNHLLSSSVPRRTSQYPEMFISLPSE